MPAKYFISSSTTVTATTTATATRTEQKGRNVKSSSSKSQITYSLKSNEICIPYIEPVLNDMMQFIYSVIKLHIVPIAINC